MIPRLRDAMLDAELTASAHRVLLYFAHELSPVEFRSRKRSVVSLEVDIPERTVAEAIAQLIRLGYIEAGTRVPGHAQEYRLVWARRAA